MARKVVGSKRITPGRVTKNIIVLPNIPAEAKNMIRKVNDRTFKLGRVTGLHITDTKGRRAVLTLPNGRKVTIVCVRKMLKGVGRRTILVKELAGGKRANLEKEELALLRKFKPVLAKFTWPKNF